MISALLFVSCGGADIVTDGEPETNHESVQPHQAKAEDFFPFRENTRYEYEGEGNEYASYTVLTEFILSDTVQQRINNGGTEIVKVFRAAEGKVTELLSIGETYYRENFLAANYFDGGRILLAGPIEEGASWAFDGGTKTITDTAFDIATPTGNYKAVEVTTADAEGEVFGLDYWAAGIGLVKSVYDPGGEEISSTLAAILENEPHEQAVTFFYPDSDNDILYYKDKVLRFYTNDDTAAVIASAYTDPGGIFSENTKINSLTLDSGIVRIDLNRAFIDEMNAGSMFESLILQCIANTFGKYYSAEKCQLTVEGKPYESGHLLFEEGDLLTVDYSSARGAG